MRWMSDVEGCFFTCSCPADQDVTKMFTKRYMFCLEFVSEKSQMTRYLSMLKTDVRQFVATQRCDTLLDLQEATRRRELELELQLKE